MVAQQSKQTPQPEYDRGYGQRARSTIPLAFSATSANGGDANVDIRTLKIEVRADCTRCHGTGKIGVSQPFCAHCRASWTESRLMRHLDARGGWWRRLWRFTATLPCTHSVNYLLWTNPACPDCGGSGGQTRPVSLTWLASALARIVEDRRTS